jgi:hypothetical protein
VSPVRRRYVAVVLFLGCLTAIAAVVYFVYTHGILYETVYLPSIDPSLRGHSLNDRGRIVLSSPAGLYVWDPDTGLRDIGVVPVTYYSRVVRINNAGQLSGAVLDPNGFMQAFFWDPHTGLQMLGTFGEETSWALGINSKGEVVGQAGPRKVLQSPPKAFLWKSGEPPALLDLRHLGFGGPASGVNDQAQVAGCAFSYGQSHGFFAFRWDPGGGLSTHLIGPAMTGEVYIDGRGSLIWARHKEPRVVIWRKDQGERQIQFASELVHILGVNDRGQILVAAYRPRFPVSRSWWRSVLSRFLASSKESSYWLCDPQRGKLHRGAHARNLSPRFQAVALNNRGWILGRDYDDTGTCRWLILKPIRGN